MQTTTRPHTSQEQVNADDDLAFAGLERLGQLLSGRQVTPRELVEFYLARIENARPTERRYSIPRDFDPERFFRNTFGIFVGGGKPFRFRVRFSREISEEVRELQFHPQQKIETGPDGEAILELPAESLKEARRFVLGYGRDAVAISPPELVEDLKKETAVLHRAYERGRKSDVPKP